MLNQINQQKIDRLAKVLNILAHPVRMQIILDLTKPTSISCLQRRLRIGQIALQQHLNQMQDNGLLKNRSQDGEIYYSLTDIALSKCVKLLLTKD